MGLFKWRSGNSNDNDLFKSDDELLEEVLAEHGIGLRGQLSDASVKELFQNLNTIDSDVHLILEKNTEIPPESSMVVPNLLAEFNNDKKIAAVYGQGTGHVFVRMQSIRELANTAGGRILTVAKLDSKLRDSGYKIKNVKYFSVVSNA